MHVRIDSVLGLEERILDRLRAASAIFIHPDFLRRPWVLDLRSFLKVA